jgi:hypothetical protein
MLNMVAETRIDFRPMEFLQPTSLRRCPYHPRADSATYWALCEFAVRHRLFKGPPSTRRARLTQT